MGTKKHATTNDTKARHLAAATDAARTRLGLETLEDRQRDALDFHDISVASIRDVIALAFEAGFAAGRGSPAPVDVRDPAAMLGTLQITKQAGRPSGGTWVSGTIAGHAFEALVFPEHAESEAFELGDSRISKLWLRDLATKAQAANFDRGWDQRPESPAAKAIVDLLAAGLAELVFGK